MKDGGWRGIAKVSGISQRKSSMQFERSSDYDIDVRTQSIGSDYSGFSTQTLDLSQSPSWAEKRRQELKEKLGEGTASCNSCSTDVK